MESSQDSFSSRAVPLITVRLVQLLWGVIIGAVVAMQLFYPFDASSDPRVTGAYGLLAVCSLPLMLEISLRFMPSRSIRLTDTGFIYHDRGRETRIDWKDLSRIRYTAIVWDPRTTYRSLGFYDVYRRHRLTLTNIAFETEALLAVRQAAALHNVPFEVRNP